MRRTPVSTYAPQIKDYSDQVSVLTSVAVERFLTPWEEQRVKELVFAMLEELKTERRLVTRMCCFALTLIGGWRSKLLLHPLHLPEPCRRSLSLHR